jgi:hypothetical protein
LRTSDPLGLWAIGYDFFWKYGWGMTVGYDEETCQPFISVRVGVGKNFSASYDSDAKRTGRRDYRGSGTTLGMYGQAGVFAGAGVGIGAEAKVDAGTDHGAGKGYQGFDADLAVPGMDGDVKKWGAGWGASAGFEASYYGKSECGCKRK